MRQQQLILRKLAFDKLKEQEQSSKVEAVVESVQEVKEEVVEDTNQTDKLVEQVVEETVPVDVETPQKKFPPKKKSKDVSL